MCYNTYNGGEGMNLTTTYLLSLFEEVNIAVSLNTCAVLS